MTIHTYYRVKFITIWSWQPKDKSKIYWSVKMKHLFCQHICKSRESIICQAWVFIVSWFKNMISLIFPLNMCGEVRAIMRRDKGQWLYNCKSPHNLVNFQEKKFKWKNTVEWNGLDCSRRGQNKIIRYQLHKGVVFENFLKVL